ncbi:MAG: amidohydrolase [Pyramidobacter sp.]|nr:amidohydrolase [Pyramidobacter sp.]
MNVSDREFSQAAEFAVNLRHELHMQPELSWKEVKTTQRIVAELEKMGVAILKTGCHGTESGVIAEVKGAKPGPCIALRADIDALPVQEKAECEWKSQVPNVMHACGHDSHAAMLVAAAGIIAAHKDEICGSVRFFFQPAEESGYVSGANFMVQEGALEGVDAVVGQHVQSDMPKGEIGWRAGVMMASADMWNATVHGQGGHGSSPHTAIDPTIAVAEMITSLQTIVSREIDPQVAAVVSIGAMKGGDAPNVIPESVYINGTVRTTRKDVRDSMEERFTRIFGGVAAAHRCTYELSYDKLVPVLANDEKLTLQCLDILKDAGLGDHLKEQRINMGSEDFSFFADKVPATYFMLGMGTPAPHHNPAFTVDDSVLELGVRLMASIALDFGKRS